jgi:hypothetical protein
MAARLAHSHTTSLPPLASLPTATRVSPSACGGSTGAEGAGEGGEIPPTLLEVRR